MLSDLQQDAKISLLSRVYAKDFLDILQQCDFNPFDPRLQRRRPFLPIKLWTAARL
jgi:hypothetical protein